MTANDIVDAGAIAREFIESLQTDNANLRTAVKELSQSLMEAKQTYINTLAIIETENRRLKKLVKDLIPPCAD